MDPSTRVCPFCGERPGEGVFCASCGRNLSGVERLPTAAEWGAPADVGRRVAEAARELLAAAGERGAKEFPAGAPRPLRRTPVVRGWVVRPVEREDFEGPKRYEPGLVLSTDGRFHRLDSELRGWGQRDFPTYHHTVSPDPVDPPPEQRLLDELAALRASVG